MLKSTLILTLLATVSGFLLGIVNDITKDVIDEKNEKLKIESLSSVVNNGEIDMNRSVADDYKTNTDGVVIEEAYEVLHSNGTYEGLVMIIATSEGYGGTIRFSLGINKNSKVTGIDFLEINETPGLGMSVVEDEYTSQFKGRNFEEIYSDYDSISGATISSDAVYEAVEQGLTFYEEYKKEVAANE